MLRWRDWYSEIIWLLIIRSVVKQLFHVSFCFPFYFWLWVSFIVLSTWCSNKLLVVNQSFDVRTFISQQMLFPASLWSSHCVMLRWRDWYSEIIWLLIVRSVVKQLFHVSFCFPFYFWLWVSFIVLSTWCSNKLLVVNQSFDVRTFISQQMLFPASLWSSHCVMLRWRDWYSKIIWLLIICSVVKQLFDVSFCFSFYFWLWVSFIVLSTWCSNKLLVVNQSFDVRTFISQQMLFPASLWSSHCVMLRWRDWYSKIIWLLIICSVVKQLFDVSFCFPFYFWIRVSYIVVNTWCSNKFSVVNQSFDVRTFISQQSCFQLPCGVPIAWC